MSLKQPDYLNVVNNEFTELGISDILYVGVIQVTGKQT